jgi:hypothetical protein
MPGWLEWQTRHGAGGCYYQMPYCLCEDDESAVFQREPIERVTERDVVQINLFEL